ncbi:hypothetical protein [Butyrivibrio sp.]|uniref:hypothetical protein n=1 Tax=Butyrivibrio sp. TaxID=28121 RepID=UPI0025C476DB|nr:hypothetical protein [Butyrivibrio sp.]MBQ9303160.1 hypothetical protein [Butyrivibrio sp.]
MKFSAHAGYYSTPITVNNGIVNKESSIKSALLATTFPAGYYSGKDIDITPTAIYAAYQGKNNTGISGNQTISKTAQTEIQLGISDSIAIQPGYYPYAVKVDNSIINRGSQECTITTNGKQTLPAGYYDGITIVTDLAQTTGSIKYYHHVHSTANTTTTKETDTITPTTDGYTDDYQSSVSGGCFTRAYYHHPAGTSTGPCGGTFVGQLRDWNAEEGEPGSSWYTRYVCNRCGAHNGTDGGDHNGETKGTCNNIVTVSYDAYWDYNAAGADSVVYECNCGYTRGQLVEARIKY